ncbi:unnamed protein product [Auanema sp. JU1783]|nr:unnamed protein product [Auanema sp. JU1783]
MYLFSRRLLDTIYRENRMFMITKTSDVQHVVLQRSLSPRSSCGYPIYIFNLPIEETHHMAHADPCPSIHTFHFSSYLSHLKSFFIFRLAHLIVQ